MTHKRQWILNKIKSRDALARACRSWQGSDRKIVFTNGCFDILHRGHLEYLAEAAGHGNMLVVGVNSDASVQALKGPGRPVIGQDDRLFALASLLFVDAVCLFDEPTPLALIEAVKPDVLAKGGDYTLDTIVGAKEVMARGGKVEIIPFVEGYSTTGFLAKLQG
jgi:rfaE bifunctional protein nucleotidyltransferase chain/domain